jgi:hypothetical protein
MTASRRRKAIALSIAAAAALILVSVILHRRGLDAARRESELSFEADVLMAKQQFYDNLGPLNEIADFMLTDESLVSISNDLGNEIVFVYKNEPGEPVTKTVGVPPSIRSAFDELNDNSFVWGYFSKNDDASKGAGGAVTVDIIIGKRYEDAFFTHFSYHYSSKGNLSCVRAQYKLSDDWELFIQEFPVGV